MTDRRGNAPDPGSRKREPYVDSRTWRLPYGQRLEGRVRRTFVTKWRQRAARLVILFLVIWIPVIGLNLAVTGKAWGYCMTDQSTAARRSSCSR